MSKIDEFKTLLEILKKKEMNIEAFIDKSVMKIDLEATLH